MVECDLAKVDVAGSNPVSRSIFLGPLAQPVEQVTLNHKVAGSTPARPTKIPQRLDVRGCTCVFGEASSRSPVRAHTTTAKKPRDVASASRLLTSCRPLEYTRCRRKASPMGSPLCLCGWVAQVVEHRTFNPVVAGSSPAPFTIDIKGLTRIRESFFHT